MSYAAVMVYVEPYARPEQRVQLAAELAAFNAQLIGLSALMGKSSAERHSGFRESPPARRPTTPPSRQAVCCLTSH
jgi:hypothetical protein